MPKRLWIALLSFWPGLPQVWSGQEALGLFLAILFAVVLNLTLVSRFVWTDLFGPTLASFFGFAAALTWLASLIYTLWWLWRCHPERHRTEIDRLYREALEAYLSGRWNDARHRWEQILAMDDTDADAFMQLGVLYVRTGQDNSARRAFRQCLELDAGGKWRWEIEQILGRLGQD